MQRGKLVMRQQPPTAIKLNRHEMVLLRVLYENQYLLSTTEISKLTKMSWNTVKIYLDKFEKKGWVEKKNRGNREYWEAILKA
jgi:DNA-binding MarR family transcriptional regulator